MNTNEYRSASEAYLRQSVNALRERIRVRLGGEKSAETNGASLEPEERALDEMRQQASGPFALDEVAAAFELTPFERDVLVLCAGVEIDAELAALCERFGRVAGSSRPSFKFAIHVLTNADWAATSVSRPLLKYELVHVQVPTEMLSSPLTIRFRILQALLGVEDFDPLLSKVMKRQTVPSFMAPSHREIASTIVEMLLQDERSNRPKKVVLAGDDIADKLAVASMIAGALGVSLYVVRAAEIPTDPVRRDNLEKLWECETIVSRCALYIDGDQVDAPQVLQNARWFADSLSGLVFLSGKFPTSSQRGQVALFEVGKLGLSEQRHMWHEALGPAAEALSERVDALVGNFHMNAESIYAVAQDAAKHFASVGNVDLGTRIWGACRRQARPQLDELALRIDSNATLDDLVLPVEEKQTLQDIMAQARQRVRVLEQGGFGAKGMRGLGLGVMFAGVSGTGKTMAAGILANELGLDLYRVDLSRVVNKYIGETEKNLARIFDAADEGGVVLLFDEADALFGKRSEVNDSHDRHANIEVSYLLQRMETYQGVAILTTNMKSALDTAFLRRLRYVVTFPFPDITQRVELWQRAFPGQTLVEGLDWYKMARLNVTGGNIRTMALNAASLAADVGEPVRMAHVRRAAYAECVKLDKSPLLGEILAWE